MYFHEMSHLVIFKIAEITFKVKQGRW